MRVTSKSRRVSSLVHVSRHAVSRNPVDCPLSCRWVGTQRAAILESVLPRTGGSVRSGPQFHRLSSLAQVGSVHNGPKSRRLPLPSGTTLSVSPAGGWRRRGFCLSAWVPHPPSPHARRPATICCSPPFFGIVCSNSGSTPFFGFVHYSVVFCFHD